MDTREIFDEKEKVQVIHGTDFIPNVLFHMMDMAEERIDIYADFRGPNIVDDVEGIGYYIAAQQRGVKIRVITEITAENLLFCKDNMKYIDGLRHLDTITHMFQVSEKHYVSTKMLTENPHFIEGVFCNKRWFVREQQYLFESLWSKAIPAKQRFKEIEEGSKREFVETIRDPVEILDLIRQIMSSAYEELIILLPTTRTFIQFESEGLFELMIHQIDKYNISVKILARGNYEETKSLEKQQNIELQFAKQLDTEMLIIIADRDKLLSIELNDEPAFKLLDSLGLTTYSNSIPTVISYVSIFEILSTQSKL